MTQTRSFSQPLPNIQSGTPMSSFPPAPTSRQPVQQQQQQPQQPQPQQQGVWADLVSLQGPSSQSSLPLQYQSPSNQVCGNYVFMLGTEPDWKCCEDANDDWHTNTTFYPLSATAAVAIPIKPNLFSTEYQSFPTERFPAGCHLFPVCSGFI